MAGNWLVWCLGVASALSGSAVLVMWQARRRARRLDASRGRGRVVHLTVVPTAADRPGDEAGAELTKICPACGSRYGVMYRTCARDNTDLAAIH